METIQTSVIAALVSAAILYWKFSKDVRLKYITKERQKWREKMRELAMELVGVKRKDDLIKILAQIKVRINAYGMSKNEKEGIMTDSHIWKVIEEIEKDLEKENNYYIQCDKSIQENNKKLIEYISLLLKMDWERAKNEAGEKSKTEIGEEAKTKAEEKVKAEAGEKISKKMYWLLTVIIAIFLLLLTVVSCFCSYCTEKKDCFIICIDNRNNCIIMCCFLITVVLLLVIMVVLCRLSINLFYKEKTINKEKIEEKYKNNVENYLMGKLKGGKNNDKN